MVCLLGKGEEFVVIVIRSKKCRNLCVTIYSLHCTTMSDEQSPPACLHLFACSAFSEKIVSSSPASFTTRGLLGCSFFYHFFVVFRICCYLVCCLYWEVLGRMNR